MINKLKIINGNTKKNVSFNFLIELYKICTGQNSDSPDYMSQYSLSNDSTIIGQVSTQNIYEHIYTYLRNKFENFFIDYDNLVIYFKDRILDALLCNKYGTNNTLTIQQAESVTSLMSFQNNTNITSFDELPYFKNVHTITDHQFYNCTNLESIDLTYINTINPYAFANCAKCHFKNINNILTLRECAFDGCKELTSIDLSNLSSSQSNISNYTFRNCTSLETVVLGPYITHLGIGSFQNCTNLTNIDLSNVTELSGSSISGCMNLPDDLDISNIEICNCIINIKDVVLPKCKTIGQSTFNSQNSHNGDRIETFTVLNAENLSARWVICSLPNLKEIHVNVKQGYNNKLGSYFGSGCPNLEVFEIGDNIKELGDNCGFGKINEVNLNKVEKIGSNVFYNNTYMIKLTAPYLKYLGNSAINRCSNLKYINSDTLNTYDLTGITYIGQSCFAFSAAKNVILDPQITELPNDVFYACGGLESVNLNNIVTLGNTVFRSCNNIKTFTFDKLETMTGEPFYYTDFEWIKITNENQVVNLINPTSSTFRYYTNTRSHRIYVPDSLYNDYLADAGWITALSTNQATLKRLSEFTTDYGI